MKIDGAELSNCSEACFYLSPDNPQYNYSQLKTFTKRPDGIMEYTHLYANQTERAHGGTPSKVPGFIEKPAGGLSTVQQQISDYFSGK